MTKLDIRVFGDPVLRQEAREVSDFDDKLADLAGDMLETLRAAEGVGLAANQVGVLKRLFTWEITLPEPEPGSEGESASARDGDREQSPDVGTETVGGAVVNPVVEETSEDTQEGDEGCLSFPGLFYPLQRPLRARVRHQDLRGDEHVTDVDGFAARVWLHEIDHLNGILFIDHLAAHDRKEAMRVMRERRLARQTEPEPDTPPASQASFLLGRQQRRL